MAHGASTLDGVSSTPPVRRFWQRSDDGGEVPALTIDQAPPLAKRALFGVSNHPL
jgi:hypothetical protein